MPKPLHASRRNRGYHHGDLKSALIEAADTLLERDGPEAISFRAIARAAGVSQTAPYNHFEDREDLLATLAADGFEALVASQRAAAGRVATDRDRIAALGRDYVRFARARPQLYRLMFGVGLGDLRRFPRTLASKKASYEPFRDALAAFLGSSAQDASATVEAAADMGWALVHGLSMLLIDRTLDPAKRTTGNSDALVERTIDWMIAGLKPGAADFRRRLRATDGRAGRA
jgi:AcrR family transcriptional regulator